MFMLSFIFLVVSDLFEWKVIHVHLFNRLFISVYSPRFLCRPTTTLYIFARAVGRQSAIHTENSGFASPTLGQHISTFRGYQILFSIGNPYINRFTDHFSIHSLPSYPQKVVLHSITARFCLRSYDFDICLPFFNICHVTTRKLRLPQCIMGDDLHINKQTNICIANHRRLLRQNN